jgi:hypothetical protein
VPGMATAEAQCCSGCCGASAGEGGGSARQNGSAGVMGERWG